MRWLSIMLLLTLVSCGNKFGQPDILPPNKMQTVLWQVLRAEAFTNGFIKKDSARNVLEENVKLQKRIFAENGVTREQFYNSYTYYKNHPGQFKVIMDSIISYANRTRNQELHQAPVPNLGQGQGQGQHPIVKPMQGN